MQLYSVTHRASGKLYIGMTSRSLHGRWLAHQSAARCGRNGKLLRAITKYGPAAFEIKTLVVCADRAYLCEIERAAIAAFDAISKGYNLCRGGEGFTGSFSAETRKKIGDAGRGRKRSPEARANMSRAQMGKSMSPATRDKLRRANLGKRLPKHVIEILRRVNTGRSVSPEHRARIGAANRGRPSPFKGQPRSIELRQKVSEAIKRHWAEKRRGRAI